MSKVQEFVEEHDIEEMIIFRNPDYDEAFIGVTQDNQAVYDYDLMVKSLMDEDGMSAEDAIEFIDYNTLRSIYYMGEGHPIILYSR